MVYLLGWGIELVSFKYLCLSNSLVNLLIIHSIPHVAHTQNRLYSTCGYPELVLGGESLAKVTPTLLVL